MIIRPRLVCFVFEFKQYFTEKNGIELEVDISSLHIDCCMQLLEFGSWPFLSLHSQVFDVLNRVQKKLYSTNVLKKNKSPTTYNAFKFKHRGS
jgi:hypothetical protein